MSRTYGNYETVLPIQTGHVIEGTYSKGAPCNNGTVAFGPTQAEIPESMTVQYCQEESAEHRVAPTDGNWSEVVRSGKVKMTEMSAYRTQVTRSPVLIPSMNAISSWPASWYNGECCGTSGVQESVALWYDVSHIDFPQGESIAKHLADYNDELNDLIVTNQQDLYRDLNEGYDLASELGELPETIRWLSSLIQQMVSVTEKFPDLLQSRGPSGRRVKLPKNRKEALKMGSHYAGKLLDRWMEYRYAIMPIVYSVKDVQEVLKFADRIVHKGSKPENVHRTIEEQYDDCPTADGHSVPLIVNIVLDTDVVSTGRILYDTGSLNRLVDQVSTNPFITAWELLPLSFVIDWFVNVSNGIFAATHVGNPFVGSSGYCTSVKQRSSMTARQCGVRNMWYWRQYSTSNVCWDGFLHEIDRSVAYPPGIVFSQETQIYRRTVWKRPSSALVFDPFLNWKRILDAIALTHKPVHKRLSRL
jgi:hypothetical protein